MSGSICKHLGRVLRVTVTATLAETGVSKGTWKLTWFGETKSTLGDSGLL